MLAAALGLGLLVGAVIGALGGGGSVLTVPLLVFALGLTAQEATTGSLIIVGLTAAVASVSHARSGGTRWATGLLLAAAGVPASLLGTHLNSRVDQGVLLLAFAGLMLVSAAGMVLRSAHEHDGPHQPARTPRPPAGTGTATTTAVRPSGTVRATPGAVRLVVAGLVLGFLTGFLGVGGGFLAVPVLVLALDLTMPTAVGTSLLVIALNSAVSLAARAGAGGHVPWEVVAPFTGAAIGGSLLGRRIAVRLPTTALTRAFAVLLVVVALYVGARALLSLR
jgi:uncharacterized protein